MRGIKSSFDKLKERVTKVESNQASTNKTLVRIETKLDLILKNQGME